MSSDSFKEILATIMVMCSKLTFNPFGVRLRLIRTDSSNRFPSPNCSYTDELLNSNYTLVSGTHTLTQEAVVDVRRVQGGYINLVIKNQHDY